MAMNFHSVDFVVTRRIFVIQLTISCTINDIQYILDVYLKRIKRLSAKRNEIRITHNKDIEVK